MASKRKRPRRPAEEFTYLAIRVAQCEASVDASVNRTVYGPQYAWRLDDEDPLYECKSRLTIIGTSLYPERRAGQAYELTIYGDASPRMNVTLKDAQARDDYGSPQYREYRGRQIPVYDPPRGLGRLEKVRGEPSWRACVFLPPHYVSEVLMLMSLDRPLFLAIHEHKRERARWIRSVSLQTTDPANE